MKALASQRHTPPRLHLAGQDCVERSLSLGQNDPKQKPANLTAQSYGSEESSKAVQHLRPPQEALIRRRTAEA